MEIIQILKFLLVGVWNTGFDLALFWVFLNLFSKAQFLEKIKIKPPVIAHVSAFLIANSVSYILNSKFTFDTSKSNRGFGPYFVVSVVSLVISTFLVHYFTQKQFYDMSQNFLKNFIGKINEKHFALIVKLGVVAVVMVVNFLGYKYFVFS
jgi:putative flippase GtrA